MRMKKPILYIAAVAAIAVVTAITAIAVIGCNDGGVNAGNESAMLNEFLGSLESSGGNSGYYTLRYNGNGNDSGTVPVDTNSPYPSGASATVLGQGTLRRTDHKFLGWNTMTNGNGAGYTEGNEIDMVAKVTLYARWLDVSIPTYAVKVSSVGTGASGDGNYAQGDMVTINSGTTSSGQRFINWTTTNSDVIFTNANNATTQFSMPADSVTVTANFEAIAAPAAPGSVTATASPGSVTVSWFQVSGAIGYRVYRSTSRNDGYDKPMANTTSLSYVDNAGLTIGTTYYYKVSAYNGGGESALSAYAEAMVTAVATNTVIVSSIGTNPSGGGSYEVGEIVTINAGTPPTGYQFVRWTTTSNVTIDSARSATTTFTMSANAVTVTATFERLAGYYSLTVKVNSSSYGTVSYHPVQAAYAFGTSVTVTANAANGYEFQNWTGASTESTNPVTITMDGDKTLTANFAAFGTGKIGTFTDTRDGKSTTYKTVLMPDGNVWMAQNLNYQTSSGSWCYDSDGSYCADYGRLYDWNTAKTACPYGWHLPTREEWVDLTKAVGGTGTYGAEGTAGKILKSTEGWGNNDGNGMDPYGFSALPGGHGQSNDSFFDVGLTGTWWTDTEYNSNNAYCRYMSFQHEAVTDFYYLKDRRVSVRCVQND